MRAGLHIHGIEVALRAEPGPLESLVLSRYWGHLGPVRRPVLALVMRPAPDGVVSLGPVDLRGGGAVVTAAIPPTAATLDEVLLSLLTPLVVRAGALLVCCDAVFDGSGAHVLLGGARRAVDGGDPTPAARRLVLHQRAGRWRTSTTPFGAPQVGWPDRRAPLHSLYVLDEDPSAALYDALVLRDTSTVCGQAAGLLAAECADGVACVDVATKAGREALAGVVEGAGGLRAGS